MIADPKSNYFMNEEDLDVFIEGMKIAREAGKEKRFLDMFFYTRHSTKKADILISVSNSLTSLGLISINKMKKRKN